MNSLDKIKGHFAVIVANIFFGLNVPLTKELMTCWLTPTEYILTRVGLATAMFWLVGLFRPKESVTRSDILLLSVGGLFGVIGAQYLVAVSLDYTSPLYFSLMSAMSPMIVMWLALFFLHEPVSSQKIIGVVIGIAGAGVLLLNADTGGGNLMGVFIAFASVTSYAIYLIIIRSVATKYSPLTQMKWTYLSASIALVPIAIVGLPEQSEIFRVATWVQYCEMGFIVMFATVTAFMLIPFGLKYLRPTTVSVYINLQPVVAASVAIILGQDNFSWEKPVAGLLVILGAYIVTTSRGKETANKSATNISNY